MLQEIIQQYCNHFALQISEIAQIQNRLFQKILYSSLLDAMGRAKFPNGGNHDRIVKFIDECSSWGDRNRISLAQLGLLESRIQSESLKTFIKEKIASWEDGSLPRPEADPWISEVPTSYEDDALVKEAQYAELFFHYRHTLIHEFREPGYGMEVSSDGSTPYYLGTSKKMDRQWELVFPVEFFKALCEGCLTGLQEYLTTQQIDPYTCYQFGSLWNQKIKNPKV